MKKLMIFIVVTTLLAIGCILPAVAAESSLTVLVRIDGKDGTLFYEEITTNNRANYSIPSILMLADNQSLDGKSAVLYVARGATSKAIGQRRKNIERIIKKYSLVTCIFIGIIGNIIKNDGASL